jgi:mitotic spindle assembly checkpoint protein MAD1
MLNVSVQCREVIDNMMKAGEANAHFKQMEVALETAQLGKQNAEAEAALAKEKAEALKLEVKQIELMVSISLGTCILL